MKTWIIYLKMVVGVRVAEARIDDGPGSERVWKRTRQEGRKEL
jgi:hypothetical protein